jgi:alpha-glucoside transport system substrate-binding protein
MNIRRWLALTVIAVMLAAACTTTPPASPTPGAGPTATPGTQPTATPGSEPTATPGSEPTGEPTQEPEPTPEPTEEPTGPVLPSTPTGYAELDQALSADQPFAGTTVSIQTQWIGGEGVNFAASLADFQAATGITIAIDSVGSNHELVLRTRIEGDIPPDLAQIAQPAVMASYARAGQLQALPYLDTDRFASDYAATLGLVTVDDAIYAIPYKLDVKSTVWYPIAPFEAAGYEVPTTWEELLALSDQIVADGANPWCISIEHGGATGWVATDWVEDVLLRTAPREVYDQWINHEIPFNDPQIKNALDHVAQIFFTENYAYGGSQYINGTWVGQTMDPAFDSPPGCYFHKQALWYSDFFPPRDNPEAQPQPGTDVGVFYFPPIDPAFGNPVLGSGDVFMVFSDRPEVRAVAQFLATPESIYRWIQAAGVTSANGSAPAEWYEGSYKAGVSAGIIANGTSFAFDASDLMPPEVGAGTFWSGMFDWIAANGTNTDQVLDTIEASWPSQ